jgi:hypothetical protein
MRAYIQERVGRQVGRVVLVVVHKDLLVGILHCPKLPIQTPANAQVDTAGALAVHDAVHRVVNVAVKLRRVPNQEVERHTGPGRGLVVGQPDLRHPDGGKGGEGGAAALIHPSTWRTFSDMPTKPP